MKNFIEKNLVIFDLDGTLAESKQPMDSEMVRLLLELLEKKKVAVISGGSFEQFKKQFLPEFEGFEGAEGEDQASNHTLTMYIQRQSGSKKDMPTEEPSKISSPSPYYGFPFSNLFLLPTSGSAMYIFKKDNWVNEYSHNLTASEKEKIYTAFKGAVEKSGEKMPEKTYGEITEDRDSQITFSAAGQQAPIEAKAQWDPTEKKRLHIVSLLKPLLPEFSIGIGGMTSIDVTKKGIDKAFGVRKICEYLKISIEMALYVGDALFPGGNDYAARASGVECVEVARLCSQARFW
jgi:phosphomannomutase